jgi:hypothetical protein
MEYCQSYTHLKKGSKSSMENHGPIANQCSNSKVFGKTYFKTSKLP